MGKKNIDMTTIDTKKIIYEIMCDTFEFIKRNLYYNKNNELSFKFHIVIDKIIPGKIIINDQEIILHHPTLISWSIMMSILDNNSTIKAFEFGFINNHCYIKSITHKNYRFYGGCI